MPHIVHFKIKKRKMKKTLPGFPTAETASAHTLKYKYDWSDEQLKWLDKFWVKIGTQMDMGLYVRPDVLKKISGIHLKLL